jgi:hypothetical protein
MGPVDFSTMPLGEHEGARIVVCPKCGRHARVQLRCGGGWMYDHLALPLDPGVAGAHLDVVEWCEVVAVSELD